MRIFLLPPSPYMGTCVRAGKEVEGEERSHASPLSPSCPRWNFPLRERERRGGRERERRSLPPPLTRACVRGEGKRGIMREKRKDGMGERRGVACTCVKGDKREIVGERGEKVRKKGKWSVGRRGRGACREREKRERKKKERNSGEMNKGGDERGATGRGRARERERERGRGRRKREIQRKRLLERESDRGRKV